MDNTITGNVKRRGGQWIIQLYLPDWAIDDILRDADSGIHSVILLENHIHDGMNTAYRSGSEKKNSKVVGSTMFGETT
jgi:hypothetical protein